LPSLRYACAVECRDAGGGAGTSRRLDSLPATRRLRCGSTRRENDNDSRRRIMKTKVLVVAVTGLIAAVIAWVYAPPERPPAPVTTEEVPVVQEAQEAAPPKVGDAVRSPKEPEQLPLLDESR